MKLSTHPLAENVLPGIPGAPVDIRLIQRLRASLGLLLAKGDLLPCTFYALLFERYPVLRGLFPKEMTEQRGKLAKTLAWVVAHLDQQDVVLGSVRDLGRRHVGYGAKPEHYPLVRDALVEAMARTGGSDWDDTLTQDWRQAIDLMARHMQAACNGGR
jgi:nitric oxide dioxygenase